ncbi:methyltransferase [Novosphingobium sp. AAP83]|uniref:class I SAM-dependent methyltransferase n=1 Tax=Novosphingobium sp. AAP83 TaxID=1523425 RepID=UPI0006B9702E|nr:class I SAM-dependent methyltransferase [Novosphingobium sp. AAP83]KPF92088.1 methyltransferase [Novosphingobium sp. AAP83]
MTDIADWQGSVGRNWAAEWQRTDTSFSGLTPQLLAAIEAEPGNRIVDIGCGAGEVAIAVANGRPDANVIGVDVSPDLVAAAKVRAGNLANLSFELADAAAWSDSRGAPDLYVSRHGVMFLNDPHAAFARLAAQAQPGARLVFSCFRKPSENIWAKAIVELLPDTPGTPAAQYAPGPFAFADPVRVRHCLAGWREVALKPIDFAYVAGAGPDAVAEAMALFQRIGPSAFALRTLPPGERHAFEKRLLALVEAHHDGARVTFSAAAWLVTATSDYSNG